MTLKKSFLTSSIFLVASITTLLYIASYPAQALQWVDYDIIIGGLLLTAIFMVVITGLAILRTKN